VDQVAVVEHKARLLGQEVQVIHLVLLQAKAMLVVMDPGVRLNQITAVGAAEVLVHLVQTLRAQLLVMVELDLPA
jgi:hypothetical protein